MTRKGLLVCVSMTAIACVAWGQNAVVGHRPSVDITEYASGGFEVVIRGRFEKRHGVNVGTMSFGRGAATLSGRWKSLFVVEEQNSHEIRLRVSCRDTLTIFIPSTRTRVRYHWEFHDEAPVINDR